MPYRTGDEITPPPPWDEFPSRLSPEEARCIQRNRRDIFVDVSLGVCTLLPAVEKIGFEVRPRGHAIFSIACCTVVTCSDVNASVSVPHITTGARAICTLYANVRSSVCTRVTLGTAYQGRTMPSRFRDLRIIHTLLPPTTKLVSSRTFVASSLTTNTTLSWYIFISHPPPFTNKKTGGCFILIRPEANLFLDLFLHQKRKCALLFIAFFYLVDIRDNTPPPQGELCTSTISHVSSIFPVCVCFSR